MYAQTLITCTTCANITFLCTAKKDMREALCLKQQQKKSLCKKDFFCNMLIYSAGNTSPMLYSWLLNNPNNQGDSINYNTVNYRDKRHFNSAGHDTCRRYPCNLDCCTYLHCTQHTVNNTSQHSQNSELFYPSWSLPCRKTNCYK